MSDMNFEQRCAIRFCFRLGHNAMDTFAKFQQAYGDNVLSRAQVFGWFKAFSEGRESIEHETRSGRPSSSRTDKCRQNLESFAFRSSVDSQWCDQRVARIFKLRALYLVC
ncbi:Protein GVQW3 [Anthophora quadrimaculata]